MSFIIAFSNIYEPVRWSAGRVAACGMLLGDTPHSPLIRVLVLGAEGKGEGDYLLRCVKPPPGHTLQSGAPRPAVVRLFQADGGCEGHDGQCAMDLGKGT